MPPFKYRLYYELYFNNQFVSWKCLILIPPYVLCLIRFLEARIFGTDKLSKSCLFEYFDQSSFINLIPGTQTKETLLIFLKSNNSAEIFVSLKINSSGF